MIALFHAMAFAKWSEATDATISEREDRLTSARQFLVEAEPLVRETKMKDTQAVLQRAQSTLLAAAAALSADREGKGRN